MFAQRELFLKPLAMYNCRGTPAFKYQRYRVGCELFHHYEHAKIIWSGCSNSSNDLWNKPDLGVYKASPIIDYAHPIIIKVFFSYV